MKIKSLRILLLVAGLCLPALPREAAAESDNIIIHTEVISVPKATAEFLLGGPEIKTNQAAALDRVHGLIGRNEASSIENLTAHGKVGPRGFAQGKLNVEWEISRDKQQQMTLNVVVGSGEDKIIVSRPITLGQVFFLGSIDPSKPTSGGAEPGTYLVFMRVQ